MPDLKTIDIDFDVHQTIEKERTSFSDSPNEALRRLLDLGASPSGPPTLPEASGSPWSSKGVTLPHGTELRMDYNSKRYSGSINNGEWLVGREALQ